MEIECLTEHVFDNEECVKSYSFQKDCGKLQKAWTSVQPQTPE